MLATGQPQRFAIGFANAKADQFASYCSKIGPRKEENKMELKAEVTVANFPRCLIDTDCSAI